MTTKFNIGDRVVISNPEECADVEEFAGHHGTVIAWIMGHDPKLYRVVLDGLVFRCYFYENELNHIEEQEA